MFSCECEAAGMSIASSKAIRDGLLLANLFVML